jgi:[ribosomal protein S18]-alanine N-acetyltransferase
MRIRAMIEADLDAVLSIASALPSAPHWPREAYEAALESEVWPQRIALVAESAGSVVGFSVAVIVAGEGEIESIAVDPGWQRRGIGMELLRELQRALAAGGALAIVLEVRESNLAAANLYEQAGFREVGRRQGYYRDPVEDAVLMQLEMP